MPGLKELNNFRNNLQNIANESDVVTQWKERYENYPYPENPPLPDVDVDDLLNNIEIPTAQSQEDNSSNADDMLGSSSNDKQDNLDSIIDGMNNFTTDDDINPDGFANIDLPPPDIFSMPTDVDFSNLPPINDDFDNNQDAQDSFEVPPNILEDDNTVKKPKAGKIDLDKWNADNEPSEENNPSLDDLLPPSFGDTDEAIGNNDILEQDNFEPYPIDIDLSKFDFTTDSEPELTEEPIDYAEEPVVPQIEELDEKTPVSEENEEIDNYPHDDITNDLSEDEISSIDNINEDSSINISEFDPSEFGRIEGEEEIKDVGSIQEEPITTEEPLDITEPEESVEAIEPIDGIEEPIGETPSLEEEPAIDLPDFDFSNEINLSDENQNDESQSVPPVEELGDDPVSLEEPPLETIEEIPSDELGNIPSIEPDLPSLDEEDSLEPLGEEDILALQDDAEEISSLEDDVLPLQDDEIEEVPSLEDDILPLQDDAEEIPSLEDDGIEEVGEADPIEEADEIEELDELPENASAAEDIDGLEVEELGDIPLEEASDDVLPLSNEEVDVMDDQELETLDEEPKENDIDLYTESQNELEELDGSAAAGVAKPKQDIPSEFDSFANIDISSGGEEANIDEHAAFTISNNILDENISDTVGGFSVPDDYTQFSQDKSSSSTKDTGKNDENISLTITEDEYQNLLDRISSFPLNVRLEIEDYLANNDDTTISKMEFVHLIVSGAKLKKIASKLSEILEKPIPIPKGFERKTAEEYEAEKRSFKYKLRHKIIPFATIASLALLLTSCICFLFWTFVYIPIVSETIYNKGYTLLEENKYSDAIQEFNHAGEYKKKKRWYFKYANGFRNKKQFQLAEEVYRRLLFDFNHDKKGGLEYVSMLRDDLHNYEKAETVLKRSVLDYHANDEQALMSLGDTYLEWARENPEKYEKARQTYSSLINMYGRKDHFLSRMMKYFIRTDKLGEVLPLKEYFLNNMKKLGIDDLTELGSYLITKRYEDDISDDDAIKNIDDVREVLEAPLKREKDNADANYNMGRFFLYNRRFDVAEHYLSKSIDTYKNTNNLSSGSIMNSIDARRLYGEILSENKEYLRAQEVYADALSSYQEYSSSRLTSPNKTVGKLYADYADVNYFISGDLGKALQAYTMAINQMNDTPSIKYRIGYIYYQNKKYEDAMKYLSLVHTEKKDDKNLLYGLGNTLYKRGSYYIAQAYYERLMEMLEAEKVRKNVLFPHSRPDHNAFVDEYMRTTNNLAVILNKLAMQDGSSEKNGRAMALFGESSRAWDALTRNQETMVASKAVSLAYLNIQNIIKPQFAFETEIYSDIPKTLENEKILTKELDR